VESAAQPHAQVLASLLLDLQNGKLSPAQARQGIFEALEHWAQEDGLAALTWLDSRRQNRYFESLELRELEANLSARLIPTHEGLIEHRTLSLPAGADRSRLLIELVQHKLKVDPSAATHWLRSIQDEALRTEALAYTFGHLIENGLAVGPALALIDSMASEPEKAAVLDGLVSRWSARSAPELAAQVSQFPREIQPHLVESIAARWADADHHAATAWVMSLPPGEGKDAALFDISSRTYQSFGSADAALALAGRIEDQKLRREASKAVVSQLVKEDKNLAASALEGASILTRAEKDSIYAELLN
jgi:hypothetical protein